MTTPTLPSQEQLELLTRVVREVTRSRRMTPEDAEDFEQSIQVRLVERDYDIFRRFTGRSSLRTYLTVVVRRLLLDWQNGQYGKWRPTTTALRLGEHAVDLERLMGRDGFTTDEAIEWVRSRNKALSATYLRRLAESLPSRVRRRNVSDEVLIETRGVDFEDPIAARERYGRHARIKSRLALALEQLPMGDRQLLALRYRDRQSVQNLAKLMKTDAKALYRRFDRVLRSLRKDMIEQGVTAATMLDTH
jgi:RNA polymerase sigma factor (sigma-70 family)